MIEEVVEGGRCCELETAGGQLFLEPNLEPDLVSFGVPLGFFFSFPLSDFFELFSFS
jgi:hypothetical protein